MTMERAPRYWHGGVPGLSVGDLLVPPPPGDTRHLEPPGECATCDARRAGQQLELDDNDPTLVYVTSDRDYARWYAAGYPRGSLYVVQPLGEMTDRYREGEGEDGVPSWGVSSARILAVYDRLVELSDKDIRRYIRRWKLTSADMRLAKYGHR